MLTLRGAAGLVLFACVAVASVFSASFARAQEARQHESLHIHVVAACKEYDAEASLRKWAKAYGEDRDVRFTFSTGLDGDATLPNLDEAAKADLLILFARRLKLEAEPLAKIAKRWEAGKPILGIRTASHAFDNETNAVLDRKVFGGAYDGHLGDETVAVTIADGASDHPILADVAAFSSSKLYEQGELADDAEVLLMGAVGDESYPVAWTHRYAGGRMVYTSLGVQSDFDDANFRRLLSGAIDWLTEPNSNVSDAGANPR